MRFDIGPRIRRAFQLALRGAARSERETDEELRAHVDLRAAQLMTAGLTREQAERAARNRFGSPWEDAVMRLHQAGRERDERLRARDRVDAIWADVAYAARTITRQPSRPSSWSS